MRARADRFRYRAREEKLMVGDHSLIGLRGSWFAPLQTVAHASLASLRKAVQAVAATYDVATLSLSPDPATEFNVGYSRFEPVGISVHPDGRVLLEIGVRTEVSEEDLRQLFAPLLGRSAAAFVGAEYGEPRLLQGVCLISVEFSPRGATVQEAISVGLEVIEFVEHLRDGDLTAESTLDLLTAGRGDLLVGHAESSWLEAKRQGYDFSTDHGKIELAQDVARFANGANPGILVVGLQTRKRRGEEIITKTCPAVDAFNTARYQQIIDARLFPPVQGLVVRNVPARIGGGRSGHMLAIYLPTQPDELKPFLVHGAVVKGKVEGAFISIVQRRGEHSIPVTAQGIHATLAAGKALLRRVETGDSKDG